MDDTSREVDPVYAEWAWFLALGLVLICCGIVAILLALFSPIPPSLVLARVLMIGGAFQIVHAFRVKAWRGFTWDLMLGLIQVFGGVLIQLDAFAGVIAMTVVVALVFLVQGLMQIALAVRVRPLKGWGWLLGSGLVALLASGGFLLKIQLVDLHTPEIIAGICLIAAGAAYVAIALVAKRFDTDR